MTFILKVITVTVAMIRLFFTVDMCRPRRIMLMKRQEG